MKLRMPIVYGVQFVVPVAAFGLFADGESAVIHHAVGEIVLVHVLHFHNDVVALVGGAVYIEYGAARIDHLIKVLRVLVADILDVVPSVEQGVQERNQVFLVQFAAKDVLETEVGIGTDIALACHGEYFLPCKNTQIF